MRSSSNARNGVLILAGPTASGKTTLAVELAHRFDAEIVGADSRQIYRGMPIGTAAPSEAQQAAARHHLVGFLDPAERYSAARFVEDAMRVIDDIHARGKRVIVVGGTGFYIRALAGDVQLAPQGDPGIRERLSLEARLHDAQFLYEWLRARDPKRAAAVRAEDRYRVLRALEVALTPRQEGRTLPSLRDAGILTLKLFLEVDDAALDERIRRRTIAMLEAGFVDEAERVGLDAVAASAVGYPAAIAYLRGQCTRDELVTSLIRRTRRYSRRQRTWFRSEPHVRFVNAADVQTAARELLGWV